VAVQLAASQEGLSSVSKYVSLALLFTGLHLKAGRLKVTHFSYIQEVSITFETVATPC
jgi:hypothetical protein